VPPLGEHPGAAAHGDVDRRAERQHVHDDDDGALAGQHLDPVPSPLAPNVVDALLMLDPHLVDGPPSS
jgi:hypothetical protein